MSRPRIVLAGQVVQGDGKDVGWTFTSGTDPSSATFFLPFARAQLIAQAGQQGPIELRIEPPGRPPLIVKNLWFTGYAPSGTPDNIGVTVADGRIWWRRVHIHRSYNLRRRTGNWRLSQEELQPVPQLAPDIDYKRFSLKEQDVAWTPGPFVEDVFSFLRKRLARRGVQQEWQVIDDFSQRTLEVDEVDLDDPGPGAIERALSVIPGARVYLDEDGTAVVYDSLSRSEQEIMDATRREHSVSPGAAFLDLSHLRPSLINVLFDYEMEIRTDFVEGAETGTNSRNASDARAIDNVIPITDVELFLVGTPPGASSPRPTGRVLHKGAYGEITAVMEAWNESDNPPPDGVPPISHEVVQKLWPTAMLEHLYVNLRGEPDPVWGARISALRGSYRQLFRLNKDLVSRAKSIRAYRVGVWDVETGSRSPAVAFSDYSEVPTYLRYLKEGQINTLIENHETNPTGGPLSGVALSRLRPAPAVVKVEDEDQGILRVEFKTSQFGWNKIVYPSTVEKRPRFDGGPGDPIIADQSKLAADHELALVFTIAPGSPNDNRRLHKVEVSSDDDGMLNMLGHPVGDAEGPVYDHRIRGGLTAARVAWHDREEATLETILGIIDGADEHIEITPINEKHLQKLAQAAAATVYEELRDRWVGGRVVSWSPGLRPTGRIASVFHGADGDGHVVTSFSLPDTVEPVDLFARLDESLRRTILQQVQI